MSPRKRHPLYPQALVNRRMLNTHEYCLVFNRKTQPELREFYDKKSRSDLLNRELKKHSANMNKTIDLGCGTGAFLRWCIAQELFFHEVKLIDYDQRLLNSVYTNFKIFLINELASIITHSIVSRF